MICMRFQAPKPIQTWTSIPHRWMFFYTSRSSPFLLNGHISTMEGFSYQKREPMCVYCRASIPYNERGRQALVIAHSLNGQIPITAISVLTIHIDSKQTRKRGYRTLSHWLSNSVKKSRFVNIEFLNLVMND